MTFEFCNKCQRQTEFRGDSYGEIVFGKVICKQRCTVCGTELTEDSSEQLEVNSELQLEERGEFDHHDTISKKTQRFLHNNALVIIVSLLVAILIGYGYISVTWGRYHHYQLATHALKEKDWDTAVKELSFFDGQKYKDVELLLKKARSQQWLANRPMFYQRGLDEIKAKQWDAAVSTFKALGDYNDSIKQLKFATVRRDQARIERKRAEEEARLRAKRLEEERNRREKAEAARAEESRLLEMVNGSRSALRKMKRLKNEHPDWSDNDCATIAQRKVYIGMTKEQAVAAWGRPNDINKTVYSFGTHEQWVYGEYGERGYLYFEDGILTSIQT